MVDNMHAAGFVESYFDAWNHCDARGVVDHLAANGTYCDIPWKTQQTRDELVADLAAFFSRDVHRYELIGDILTGKDSIAYQYKWWSVDGAGGNGHGTRYVGAEFLTLSGDLAIRIADYYVIPGMLRSESVANVISMGATPQKYAKSGLRFARLEEFKRRLTNMMQTEKTYLVSDLTLPKLARLMDCSVNHLSQVINSGFGMSFFDYLNQYRVEYAKRLFGEEDVHNRAILNVAFAVGFNSSSAFYAAFKKSCGLTPAQYRRTLIKKTH